MNDRSRQDSIADQIFAGKVAQIDALRAENGAADPPLFVRRLAEAEAAVVGRDLADMSATAREIAIELSYAADALGQAYEGERDEAQAKAGALALLRSAAAGIADLIAEVEGAA